MNLLLNNKIYNYQQIKTGKYKVDSAFEARTLTFCNQWLNGEVKFEQKTSGSTGSPKTIRISREQMKISASQTIEALGLELGDTALVCVDPAYIAGKMMIVRAFEHGLQLTITEPSVNPLLGFNNSFDFIAMVPMQMENCINNPFTKENLSSCKAIIIGGAPVNINLAKQIAVLKTPIFATYGMTETISHIALKRLSFPADEYYTTVGDISIETNKAEQLIIKGAVTNNQKLISNDRVKFLSPTTFKWLGRIDNIVNSGGVKIQIEDVETSIRLLFNDLDIKNQFFLARKSDVYLGDIIVLFIESKKQLNQNDLMTKLKDYLEKFSSPKEIIQVPKFEETSSGKINKRAIINNNF
jgi:o-succinylbenzoate---CoA ligase